MLIIKHLTILIFLGLVNSQELTITNSCDSDSVDQTEINCSREITGGKDGVGLKLTYWTGLKDDEPYLFARYEIDEKIEEKPDPQDLRLCLKFGLDSNDASKRAHYIIHAADVFNSKKFASSVKVYDESKLKDLGEL